MISFTVKNTMTKRVVNTETNLRYQKKVLNVIGKKAWEDVLDHFRKQQTPKGRKWQKWLLPGGDGRRVPYRPYGKGGTKLLEDTGTLRTRNRWKVKKDHVYVYNDSDYAFAQHRMRAFMGLSKKKKEEIKKYYASQVLRK